MRRLFPLVVLSALAAPLAARADGSIVLNARAGVAKPFGEADERRKARRRRSPGPSRSRRISSSGSRSGSRPARTCATRRRASTSTVVERLQRQRGLVQLQRRRLRRHRRVPLPRAARGRTVGRGARWLREAGGDALAARREGDDHVLGPRARRPGGHRLRARRPHPRAVAVRERRPVQDLEGRVERRERRPGPSTRRRCTAGSRAACARRCCSDCRLEPPGPPVRRARRASRTGRRRRARPAARRAGP